MALKEVQSTEKLEDSKDFGSYDDVDEEELFEGLESVSE